MCYCCQLLLLQLLIADLLLLLRWSTWLKHQPGRTAPGC
jgi:hypothetical protein